MSRTCFNNIKKFFIFTIVFVVVVLGISSISTKIAKADDEPIYNVENISTYVNNDYDQYVQEMEALHQEKYHDEDIYPKSNSEDTDVIYTINGIDYYQKGTQMESDDQTTTYVMPVIISHGYLFRLTVSGNYENDNSYAVVGMDEVTKELIESKIVIIKEALPDGTFNYYRENVALSNLEDLETQKMLYHSDENMVTWSVNVEQSGFYNLALVYYPIEGNSSNIERSLAINGKVPFSGADSFSFSRIWQDTTSSYEVDENGDLVLKTDVKGNDMKPKQVENPKLITSYFVDDMGYTTEPYMFYLEKGTNYLSLISIKEPVIIDKLLLTEVQESEDYQTYLQNLQESVGSVTAVNQSVTLQAEKTYEKSSPTLYPITDRSSSLTYPFSYSLTKLNSIGGTNWAVLGDWVSWQFEVPESGYYNISMRAKQNMIRGMYSSRKLYINDQILFDELNDVRFSYGNRWQIVTVGNGEEDYLFYFEKGQTYTLKMEVTLGAYAPLIEEIQECIDDLSAIYRMIIAYTTVTPDAGRDYELTSRFPTLISDLTRNRDRLEYISNSISEISGGKSDKTGVIDSMVRQLNDFIDKHRSIPERLSTFNTNISSLGTLLNDLRELPLQLDYIQIHTPDVELGRANENFFRRLWDGVVSFFLSFFIDYSAINATEESTTEGEITSLEVWMTLGRDQANVIRSLIDTDFTRKYPNISVELKLTGADVLLKATLAGIGPDVALNVDSSLPVNYALRNAIYDLSEFIYEYKYDIELNEDGTYRLDSRGLPILSNEYSVDSYGNKTIETGYILASDMNGDLDNDRVIDEFAIQLQLFMNRKYPTYFDALREELRTSSPNVTGDDLENLVISRLNSEVYITSGMTVPTYIYDLYSERFTVSRNINNSKIDTLMIKDQDFLLLAEGTDYNFYRNTTAYNYAQNVYMESSLRQFQFAYEYDSNQIGYGTYALPERQIFLMMFVRDDIMSQLGLTDMIPETWDDMIDLIAELQTNQLQFYLPVNEAGAIALNPIFISKLYQEGGQLYADDNKSSALKSDAAMRAFEEWTEYYTLYSFPKSASFINRFRSGEMPIGVSYYEMYNTLSVFAPELKGKWSFHMIPGTEKSIDILDDDGNPTGNTLTYVDHTATASGTGCVMMRQPSSVSAEQAQKQKDASWEFMKWWSSSEVQTSFGREMEGILGSAARHATANVKALQQLAWPRSDLNILMEQWSQVHEMPQIAGSYITGREIENAYRQVINNFYNPREVLYEYAENINVEIDRKRTEFKLRLK